MRMSVDVFKRLTRSCLFVAMWDSLLRAAILSHTPAIIQDLQNKQ
jgi:hypothetical protein